MSFNIHCLSHLPDVVRDLGPLWVTSCFPLEHQLGQILKYVHGTRHVDLQIFPRISYHIGLSIIIDNLDDETEVKKFCTDLLSSKRNVGNVYVFDTRVYLLGKLTYHSDQELPNTIQLALQALEIQMPSNVATFNKLRIANRVLYSQNHRRSVSFCSYCISVSGPTGIEFGFIQNFLKTCHCQGRCNPNNCNATIFILLKRQIITSTLDNLFQIAPPVTLSQQYLPKLHYIYKVTASEEEQLITVNCFRHVCFVVPVGINTFICEPINTMELE